MEKYSLEEEKVDTEMLFWEKLIELQVPRPCCGTVCIVIWSPLLQYHMVTAHGNLGSHQFGAVPQSWPLIGKTLPYWLDEKNNVRSFSPKLNMYPVSLSPGPSYSYWKPTSVVVWECISRCVPRYVCLLSS